MFVYTTFPSLVEAEAAARLCRATAGACANILSGLVSHHRWEGKVEPAEEVVAIFKTRSTLAGDMRQAVRDNHPYELPAIAVTAPESVHGDHFGWILDTTKPG